MMGLAEIRAANMAAVRKARIRDLCRCAARCNKGPGWTERDLWPGDEGYRPEDVERAERGESVRGESL